MIPDDSYPSVASQLDEKIQPQNSIKFLMNFETEIEILSISKILFLCSLGMVDFQKENHFQKRKILTL